MARTTLIRAERRAEAEAAEAARLAAPTSSAPKLDWPERFPNVLHLTTDDVDIEEGEGLSPPFNLVELRMNDLSYALRSKPMWWEKIQDGEIRARWRAEALQQFVRNEKLTEENVDVILKELEVYAQVRDNAKGIQPSLFDCIWEASSMTNTELTRILRAEIKVLRSKEPDWHPDSNEQVLDLVHPSMYCIRYNKTVAANADGSSSTVKPTLGTVPEGVVHLEDWYVGSKTTCWLPTDFIVSEDGTRTKSRRYINNVHPIAQKDLRSALEDLLAAFIPLFDRVLSDVIQPIGPRTTVDQLSTIVKDNEPKNADGQPIIEYGGDEEDEARFEKWVEEEAVYKHPEVPYLNHDPPLLHRGQGLTLKGRQIQVITKIAEIQLTPEKPDYPGGSWHVEGLLNESIAATGILYLESENITASRLAFRKAFHFDGLEVEYEQNDPYRELTTSYGVSRDDPCVQDLGSFECKEGSAIAFPNIYQHCIEPFSLEDKTKEGHRTIIAFFLCDPARTIPSSTIVPPQQADWLEPYIITPRASSRLAQLPAENRRAIFNCLIDQGVLATRSTAEAVRLQLMKERSANTDDVNSKVFQREFNFCEH